MNIFALKTKLDRPCDACAVRKVKCDLENPCSRCIQHYLECSNSRRRGKSGPKRIHEKTRRSIQKISIYDGRGEAETDEIKGIKTNGIKAIRADCSHCSIPFEKIIPFIEIYQIWFYSIWPITSSSTLVSRIGSGTIDSCIMLDENNANEITFACALCATICQQLTFLSYKPPEMEYPEDISASEFAQEVLRIRLFHEYRQKPTVNTLLCLFFMYAYYTNKKGEHNTAAFYLREAVSLVQILGLTRTRSYKICTVTESHLLQKVYYNVLIAERYYCIENGSSALLDSTIPFPNLRNEKNPERIVGFLELIKIFSIPSKLFFDNLINELDDRDNLNKPTSELIASKNVTPANMIGTQKRLANIAPFPLTTDIQKLDLILSKSWIMSLAWRLSYDFNILISDAPQHHCLSMEFPFQIIGDFLTATKNLDTIAFECNRKGVQFKMLQIANTILISLKNCGPNKERLDSLKRLFELIFNPRELLFAIEELEHLEGINSILKSYCKYFQNEGLFDIETVFHTFFEPDVQEIHSEPDNERSNEDEIGDMIINHINMCGVNDEADERELTREVCKDKLRSSCSLDDFTFEQHPDTIELNDEKLNNIASEMLTRGNEGFNMEWTYEAFPFDTFPT